jgi:hypothetical protein
MSADKAVSWLRKTIEGDLIGSTCVVLVTWRRSATTIAVNKPRFI